MKRALIVANLAGFASFLLNDMDTLRNMGYLIDYAANTVVLPWDDTKAELEKRNVQIMQVDFDSKNPFAKKNVHAYQQLKAIVNQGKYDIIHCHTPIAGLLTRLAAKQSRKKGTKVIYTTHGFSFTSRSSLKTKLVYQTIEKIGARFSDAIITINREDYEAAKKMPCKKVHYIHGVGVDTERYENVEINKGDYRKKLGVDDDEILVLSVGELSHRKNHQIIIEALSKAPLGKKYVYVICGNGVDGGTGKELRRKAEESKVRLILLGFRHDIPQIMHCSDVGAIPSVREGLGLAGIQSLAAGVPLVGTDVQGIKDYIINGETGYLCDAFDAEGFLQAIEKLSEQTNDERAKMKKRCVLMSKNFDIEISADEMREIYKSMC